MYVIIRAGGVGSRLWPLSRSTKPKQLQPLLSDNSMLRDTIERSQIITDSNKIFISTNKNFYKDVSKEVGDIPEKNIIIEPDRKDTAAAIGLESVYIAKTDPEAILVGFPCDHLIKYPEKFKKVITSAEKIIKNNPNSILTVGISPTYPDTGYGYIELGEQMNEIDGNKVYKVKSFTEKPDMSTAKKFVSAGNYLWNGNYFAWKVSYILELYKEYLPDMYSGLMKIRDAIGTDSEMSVLEEEYAKFEKVAVEFAIIEKAPSLIATQMDVGWSDIGDFSTLKDELADTKSDNLIKAKEKVVLDSRNCLVYEDNKGKLVATVGTEDLVVVDTKDVLLICDKNQAQDVKKIVEELKEKKQDKYL